MNKLYVFDMDGTLLPKSTASIEIAKVTGTLSELHELEERFSAGDLNTKMFANEIHKLWGVLDISVIKKAFEESTKLKNIDTVISILSARGDSACVITMSPDFFAEQFYEYGFKRIFASQFPRSTGEKLDLGNILTPEDKLVITRKFCDELGVDIVDVVAFGDSMSDYPLFANLVHTVSVNGTVHLKKLSKYHYEGHDLLELFQLHQL